MEKMLQAFLDKANMIWAGVITGLTAIFGAQWYVFFFFLVLNCVDFYYGRAKAKKTETLSSKIGANGVKKKVGYWVIIALAFMVAGVMIDMGAQIGVNLEFLRLLGWFVLAVYIINELTSIVENLQVLGVNVPKIFLKGLAVMRSAVDAAGDKIIPGDKNE